MPVEIRELEVRVQVGSRTDSEPSAPDASPPASETQRAEWLADCIEQVFSILESKKER